MDAVNVILTAPAIVAIVQLIKAFGVAGKWAMLAAVVVAVALFEAVFFLGSSGAFQAAMQGLLVGLSAAGIYDVAKLAGGQSGSVKMSKK